MCANRDHKVDDYDTMGELIHGRCVCLYVHGKDARSLHPRRVITAGLFFVMPVVEAPSQDSRIATYPFVTLPASNCTKAGHLWF